MANIDLERKEKTNAWPWIIGLLVLVLAIWGVAEAVDVDEPDVGPVTADETVDPYAPAEPTGEMATAVTLGAILDNPQQWVDQPFPTMELEVSEVSTDRGFWLQDGDERLFAVLIDQPAERPIHVQEGQRLRIEGGTLRNVSHLPNLEGDPIEEDTRNLVQNQEIFLVVDESNIEVVTGA